MNLRIFRWTGIFLIALVTLISYAQDEKCEIEKANFDTAALNYNTARENLKNAEVALRPIQEFYETHAKILTVEDPTGITTLANTSFNTLFKEQFKEQGLAPVMSLCRTNILTGLFCTVVEACVEANIALGRDWYDPNCTISDVTRTQLAPIVVPAIAAIYQDEFRDVRLRYENATADLVEAQALLNVAIQSRNDCFERAQIYNRVCEFGPPSRLAVGIYGEIRFPTDGDLPRPEGGSTNYDEPIVTALHVAPTKYSAHAIGTVLVGSEFIVTGGPQCAEGVTWWYVSLLDVNSGDINDGWLPEGNSTGYFTQPIFSGLEAPDQPVITAVPTISETDSQIDCLNLEEGCFDFYYRFEDAQQNVVLQGTAQPTNLFADYPGSGPYPVYSLETSDGAVFYLVYMEVPASLNPVYPTNLLVIPEYEKEAYIPSFNSDLIRDTTIINGYENGDFGIVIAGIPIPQSPELVTNSCGGSSSLSESYVSDGVCLKYPAGWVLEVQNKGITLANNQTTFDALTNAGASVTSGQQIIWVLTDVTIFGMLVGRIDSPLDMVNLIGNSSDEDFTYGEAIELTIGGKPAARKTASGNEGDMQFIVIKMGSSSDIRDYIMVWGVTARGEMGKFEETLYAVAESIVVK